MGTIAATPAKPFVNHFSDAVATREFWNRGFQFISHSGKIVEWGCSYSENAALTGQQIGKAAKSISYLRGVVKLTEIFELGRIPKPEEIEKPLDMGLYVSKKVGSGVSQFSKAAQLGHDVGIWDLKGGYDWAFNIGTLGAFGESTMQLVSTSKDVASWRNEIHLARRRLSELHENALSFEEGDQKRVEELEAIYAEKDLICDWLTSAESQLAKRSLDVIQVIWDIASIIFQFVAQFYIAILYPIVAFLEIGSAIIGGVKLWDETSGNSPTIPFTQLEIGTAENSDDSTISEESSDEDSEEENTGGFQDYSAINNDRIFSFLD